MNEAIRDVLVEDYEDLISGLTLPDPDDRHVLAAAIKAGAQVIVTHNISDFPPSVIGRYDIEAQPPDEFLLNLIDLDASAVAEVIKTMEFDLVSRPGVAYVLACLEKIGLTKSVAAITPFLRQE